MHTSLREKMLDFSLFQMCVSETGHDDIVLLMFCLIR